MGAREEGREGGKNGGGEREGEEEGEIKKEGRKSGLGMYLIGSFCPVILENPGFHLQHQRVFWGSGEKKTIMQV